jgi:hypothetical protein
MEGIATGVGYDMATTTRGEPPPANMARRVWDIFLAPRGFGSDYGNLPFPFRPSPLSIGVPNVR